MLVSSIHQRAEVRSEKLELRSEKQCAAFDVGPVVPTYPTYYKLRSRFIVCAGKYDSYPFVCNGT